MSVSLGKQIVDIYFPILQLSLTILKELKYFFILKKLIFILVLLRKKTHFCCLSSEMEVGNCLCLHERCEVIKRISAEPICFQQPSTHFVSV